MFSLQTNHDPRVTHPATTTHQNGWTTEAPVNTPNQPNYFQTLNNEQWDATDSVNHNMVSPLQMNGGDKRTFSVTPAGSHLAPPPTSIVSSGGISSRGSLTGSNDSLLSDGSVSLHTSSQNSYAPQPRYGTNNINQNNPSLPPKESSLRHSGSSFRSTSTGLCCFINFICILFLSYSIDEL